MSDQEVQNIISNLNHLLDNCTQNFRESELIEVGERFKLVRKQCDFWGETDNTARQIYDLKDFGMWFCDKIAEVEKEFWDEESS